MKVTPKRISALIFALLMVYGAIWLVRLIWFRPADINHFYERAFWEYLQEDPEWLSSLDPPVLDRFTGFSLQLTDISPTGISRRKQKAESLLQTLQAYDVQPLTEEQQITYEVLEWFLNQQIQLDSLASYTATLDEELTDIQQLIFFLSEVHPIRNAQEASAYVTRLHRYPQKLEQLIALMEARKAQRGNLPAQVVRGYSDSLEVLYTSFARRAVNADPVELNQDQASRYLGQIEEIIQEEILPAQKKWNETIPSFLSHALDSGATVPQPFYPAYLQKYTTLDLSPDELIEIGQGDLAYWKELGGGFSSLTPEAYVSEQEKEAAQLALRKALTAQGERAEQLIQGLIPEEIPAKFHVRTHLDDALEMPLYEAPGLRQGRPGRLFLPQEMPLSPYQQEVLGYFYGIPGLHLQQAFQVRASQHSIIRRAIYLPVFSEGWAYYAISLMHRKLGFFSGEPEALQALCQWMALGAGRLIVDAHIHTQAWTREEAIHYLEMEIGLSHLQAQREVDHIGLHPGRMSAGWIGYRKMRELEQRCEDELGNKFLIQNFIHQIISLGCVPLPLLERHIENYLEQEIP